MPENIPVLPPPPPTQNFELYWQRAGQTPSPRYSLDFGDREYFHSISISIFILLFFSSKIDFSHYYYSFLRCQPSPPTGRGSLATFPRVFHWGRLFVFWAASSLATFTCGLIETIPLFSEPFFFVPGCHGHWSVPCRMDDPLAGRDGEI